MDVRHFNHGQVKRPKAAPPSFEDAALMDGAEEVSAMFTLDSDFDMLGVDTSRGLEVAPGIMCYAHADGVELARAQSDPA